MGIIVESQAEMANIMHAVFGFHHGPQDNSLHELALTLAFYLANELVNRLDHGVACAVSLHLQAKIDDELAQVFHLLGVGIVMNSIRQYLGLPAFSHTSYTLRDRAVSQ